MQIDPVDTGLFFGVLPKTVCLSDTRVIDPYQSQRFQRVTQKRSRAELFDQEPFVPFRQVFRHYLSVFRLFFPLFVREGIHPLRNELAPGDGFVLGKEVEQFFPIAEPFRPLVDETGKKSRFLSVVRKHQQFGVVFRRFV